MLDLLILELLLLELLLLELLLLELLLLELLLSKILLLEDALEPMALLQLLLGDAVNTSTRSPKLELLLLLELLLPLEQDVLLLELLLL